MYFCHVVIMHLAYSTNKCFNGRLLKKIADQKMEGQQYGGGFQYGGGIS